ncbi:MAG: hypothetical protein ACRYFK_14360 [Janthinobacterium lividum]
MPTNPYIVALDITQPAGRVRTGKLHFVVDAGDSVGPLLLNCAGLTAGPIPLTPLAVEGQYGYDKAGIPSGTHTLEVQDGSSAGLPGFTHDIIIAALPPRYGCTDPLADNYDPEATDDNGSCAYTPHVKLAGNLPELAALGVPLLARLAAALPVGAVGAPATCLLDLAALGSALGVQVRIDGYLFTSGPLIVPGRFQDAPSLLAALQALPVLAASYQFSQPAPTQVLLTAFVPGLPGAPTVTSSSPAVAVTLTAGVAALWSQRRYRWACWLEVWAGCGNAYGGATDKASAKLAQRLELPYRADNAYQFDLAPALAGFTGHASPRGDGSSPERLVSYFLRYGESYADAPTGPRRAGAAYESPIAWGLEAMQVPAALGGLRLLTTRPTYQVAPGARLPFAVLAPAGADARLLLRYRLATSRDLVSLLYPQALGMGQVTRTALRLPIVAGLLSGELRVSDSQGTVGPLLAALTFDALGPALTFVNRAGGQDTVWLAGSQEPSGKRTAATFSNALGPQNLSADYQPAQKLYSQTLDVATWDWLRQELAVSPQAWLETEAGAQPVLVSDLATEADVAKGFYSLSVDLQPAPVRGLSN